MINSTRTNTSLRDLDEEEGELEEKEGTVISIKQDLINGAGYITSASLADLTDVSLEDLSDGQTIVYSEDEDKWINATVNSAVWGNITGTLSSQTDLQNALDAKQATLVSGTNIKTINSQSILGSGNITVDALPSQTGQSGKFLTTDGTDASWGVATKVTIREWS